MFRLTLRSLTGRLGGRFAPFRGELETAGGIYTSNGNVTLE